MLICYISTILLDRITAATLNEQEKDAYEICVYRILGISYVDKITNEEVVYRDLQKALSWSKK